MWMVAFARHISLGGFVHVLFLAGGGLGARSRRRGTPDGLRTEGERTKGTSVEERRGGVCCVKEPPVEIEEAHANAGVGYVQPDRHRALVDHEGPRAMFPWLA